MIKLCAFSDEADESLIGQLKALNENGIPYMEIRSVDGVSVIDFTLKQAREYNKRILDGGIAVWSVGSPLGKEDITNLCFETYKDKVRHVCELAHVFNTPRIRMFSFYNAYGERNQVIDYLSQMVEIGKEYGVYMCHENEKDIYGDTAERVVDLLDSINGLRCVYDPANFIQSGEKADKTLAMLQHRADYFHVKDVIEATQEIVPAGDGDGKIDKLLAAIEGDKVLTLEPHLTVFGGYANIDHTEMKNKFVFESQRSAFDAAVKAIKNMLAKAGYKEKKEGFCR